MKLVNPISECTKAVKFLVYAFPTQADTLCLSALGSESTAEINNLMNPMLKTSAYVRKGLWLEGFKLTAVHLMKIIEAFRLCENLTFYNCTIVDLHKKLEFAQGLPYNYKKISFEKWGDSLTNETLENLLQAIKLTNMAATLEEIDLRECSTDVYTHAIEK